MRIEATEPNEGKIIAILVIFLLVFIAGCWIFVNHIQEDNKDDDLQKMYEKGYIEGYVKGKKDGAMQVIEIRHQLDSIAYSRGIRK